VFAEDLFAFFNTKVIAVIILILLPGILDTFRILVQEKSHASSCARWDLAGISCAKTNPVEAGAKECCSFQPICKNVIEVSP
jgi:hypothetical protein